MRTANTGQSSDGGDGADQGDGSAQLGGGYQGDVTTDLTEGYGDGFDDDVPAAGDSDTTADVLEDLGVDQESVADMSETEAEDVLVDVVQAEGYSTSEAEEIVDDLESDTGMSATELLEDFVDYYEDSSFTNQDNMGFDGSDLASEADALMAQEPVEDLDMDASDLDMNHDGKITQVDAHEAHHSFDFGLDG